MSSAQAFELIREEQIDEVNALARYYRHKKTGAELISLLNEDENKVFGISFKTPPEDSTGIAHILEHSVLCGSEKFPVKKPFVEMLKGSLQTFLNAMTFPDKTVYPVASQNLADFHNLVEVYLDAVFFPLLSEETFLQEGWHYELESPDAPLIYKGVVFNEMKGAYSSPDQLFRTKVQSSLFPDTIYGHSSGGDPKAMPDLTYEQFRAFHTRYYHPSNAQIIFYGDDDPDQRLEIAERYLGRFERSESARPIALQPRFETPRRETHTYPADEDNAKSAMVSVNWLLDPFPDTDTALAHAVLSFALVGTSAAPLRKALVDSGLGEGLTGSGLAASYRQPWFSVGLKGIDPADADQVEALILETLSRLADEGIDKATIEATVNTLEFHLRENNTGSFPRGIAYFFGALQDWLHGKDPLDALKFEAPLARLKARLDAGEPVLEPLIRAHLLDNGHRTTVLLKADKDQAAREAAEETARLDAARSAMSADEIAAAVETTRKLKALQGAPDKAEDLARIPTLTLDDLPREVRTIPTDETSLAGTRVLTHALPTNGIVYLDLAFDLHALTPELLPYLPLFARALLQTGTEKEDFVALSQRIGRSTGGIAPQRLVTARVESPGSAAMLVLRAKATADKAGEMLDILADILLTARLDNKERIRQIVLEDKARFESALVPQGHLMAFTRLRAALHQADWLSEQFGGISHLFFLRDLTRRIETDWPSVEAALNSIRERLVSRPSALANVTAEEALWTDFAPRLEGFLSLLPDTPAGFLDWGALPAPKSEGLTFPSKVNYVAKGANLHQLGCKPTGSLSVVTRMLSTAYLWDKIRVEGGAYGGFARFDPFSGIFAFGSYRDPNLTASLDVYDAAEDYLRKGLTDEDITRSIIGTIGETDGYMLPDAKGYTALVRRLAGATDAYRQQRREEVLATSRGDLAVAADALALVANHGHVVVLGSDTAIAQANAARDDFLSVTKVL